MLEKKRVKPERKASGCKIGKIDLQTTNKHAETAQNAPSV